MFTSMELNIMTSCLEMENGGKMGYGKTGLKSSLNKRNDVTR
jgi:hypothetical protein